MLRGFETFEKRPLDLFQKFVRPPQADEPAEPLL
jgi:hypothetical protein